MRADRHDVGGAVRQPDAGAGQRDLHHVLGEVARRMGHVLMRGGDRQGRPCSRRCRSARATIVRRRRRRVAEARSRPRPRRSTAWSRPSARCRNVPAASPRARSTASQAAASAATCAGDVIFGSVTTNSAAAPVRAIEQPRQEQIERAQAAALQFLAERLDANADARRQRRGAQRRGHVLRLPRAQSDLLRRPARAEAVLEVDPEVLDRLPRQFVDDPRIDAQPRAREPIENASASLASVGAYSSSVLRAAAPSFRAMSDVKRCAPP